MRTLVAVFLVLGCGIVSRAHTFAYVSLAKDKKISVYQVDVTTGALTHVADAACEGEPGGLVANPARTSLFASLRPEGKLVAFRINSQTGTLEHVNTALAGPDPAQLSTDKEGRFLLAAYYMADKVDDEVKLLQKLDWGKPIVIGETFPLSCGADDERDFLLKSREFAHGWIGHWPDESPAELAELKKTGRATIHNAIWLSWVDLFKDIGPLMTDKR